MALTIQNNNAAEHHDIAISEARLRDSQSVRTTFRLPVHLIELLGIVAGQFGVKQKSLFDQLIEDRDVLNELAEWAGGYTPDNRNRRTKTYVLSKRSLLALERVVSEKQVSRDILVEISIRRLLPVLIAERKKHINRARIQSDMEKYLRHGYELLAQAERLLGTTDPVYEMVGRMVRLSEEKMHDLTEIVARGKILEQVDLERFSGDVPHGG